MKHIIYIMISMMALSAHGQVVIDPKGTKFSLDTSKWKWKGNDIYNKNAGKIGIGTASPSAQLHTTLDVRFEGIGTNTINTNVLTADAAGNITTRSFPSFLTDHIINNNVLSQVPSGTFKGRISAGAGVVEDLSAAEATSMLNTFTTSANGLVPASGAANNAFLRSDGTWTIPNLRTFSTAPNDVSNASTTLAVVTGLSFNVLANTTYRFRAMIPFTSSRTNNGTRWTIDGPAASLIYYSSRYTNGTNSETINYCNNYLLPSAANNNSESYSIVIIEGVIRPSADGIIEVKFASGGTATITAKAGATLEYW
ncbi:MAG: hypothetical protein ACO3BD_08025 [Chitinophagaceae bacterium]